MSAAPLPAAYPPHSPAGSTALTGLIDRRRTRHEIWIVIGLSVLPSAVYALVSLADRLTRDVAIAEQTTTLNASASSRWIFDLLYRGTGIAADLVVVLLVLWLLTTSRLRGSRRIGLSTEKPARGTLAGLGFAALIGIPGIGLYLISRLAGLTPQVATNADALSASTVVILLLSAVRAALIEEVVVVGYLMTRLADLGWSGRCIIVASALLRGSYHLYQGVAMGLGNVAMGLVFAIWFRRSGSVWPLVVAHFTLDAVSFLGYPIAQALWPGLA